MPIPAQTGVFDRATRSIVPQNTGTWANLSANNSQSWSTMSSWITEPNPYLIYNSPAIDLGSSQTFNLNMTADIVGNVTYKVYTTDTVFSNAATTTTTISPGATDITAFQGRYVAVSANVTTTGGLQTIRSWTINPNTRTIEITLNGVNTSTLSGNTQQRELNLGRAVSYVYNLQMTPHYTVSGGDGNPYVATDYVDIGYVTGNQVIGAFPQIVNKIGGGANICIVDNEGQFVNSTVDITATALPEQYRIGNNVNTR